MDFLGAAYAGDLTKDGHRGDGLGQYILGNGDLYLGEMHDGLFHGRGILFFRNHKYQTISLFEGEDDEEEEGAAGSGANSPYKSGSKAAAADDDGKKELEDFLDHHNTLYEEVNKAHSPAHGNGSEDAEGSGAAGGIRTNFGNRRVKPRGAFPEDYWDGLYRGVWEHGNIVSGCYVFSDGLVYTAQDFTAPVPGSRGGGGTGGSGSRQGEWAYCRTEDRRLWSEHLRNITPVVPQETLGGFQRQAGDDAYTTDEFLPAVRAAAEKRKHKQQNESNNGGGGASAAAAYDDEEALRRWADMPVVAPTALEVANIPPAFAEGQPRGGFDILLFGDHPGDRNQDGDEGDKGAGAGAAGAAAAAVPQELRERVLYFLSLPTPQLEAEVDDNDLLDEQYREMMERRRAAKEGGFDFGGFRFRGDARNDGGGGEGDGDDDDPGTTADEAAEYQITRRPKQGDGAGGSGSGSNSAAAKANKQAAMNEKFDVEKNVQVVSSAIGIVPGVSEAVWAPNFHQRVVGRNRELMSPRAREEQRAVELEKQRQQQERQKRMQERKY